MQQIPVNLNGYKLIVVEAPAMKTRQVDGRDELVTDRRTGATLFEVSLFARQRPEPGQKAAKGEEIKVTLATDPGEGFEEDTRVELVGATVSPYSFKNDKGETVSGIAFRALGLKPLDY
ncbi:hypothetical protein GCM10010174_34980 [Kutzneria viridogrisea]|uniref:Uncharacterized protein n=1 Tax=Kutzneria viridogrisea TaxID=47990 RepID=A0ABR6BLD7_9PSEU|nr:hypothetical protein [Kutzneria viridogrisea]